MKSRLRPSVTSSHRATVEALEQRIAPAALVGLDKNNHLLAFDSASPGTVTTTTVTGLGAGETLVGIDVRPATGALYGITTTSAGVGHVYLINPATGVATFSSVLAPDPTDTVDGNASFMALSGTNFGVDFNPAADRLRVVSDTNQNLRINVDTGLVFTDLDLNPAGSTLAGAAYTKSFAGATNPVALFDIDLAGDRLVLQNPNPGTLTGVGTGLGVGDITGAAGFDIVSTRNAAGSVTETGLAALTVGGVTSLYTIDLVAGTATSAGAVGTGTVELAGLTALLPAGAPAAKGYTVDSSNNHLLSFSTATPSAPPTDLGAITNLGGGETIIGFDFRPNNGMLYLVTKDGVNSGHLYTVNTGSAVATPLGLIAGSTLSGTDFGVDFNPTNNALRIVSNTGQNLAVNVDTQVATVQTALNGGTTGAVDAAYSNNFNGATTTTLYYINSDTDELFFTTAPGSGTSTLVGSLGVNATAVGGFDIGTNGQAFATLRVVGAAGPFTGLYSIDLQTGAATSVGDLANFDPADSLGLALAPSGSFQFSATNVTVAEGGGMATLTIDRVGGSEGTTTVLVNTSSGTAGTSDFTTFSKAVTFGNGVTSQNIQIPITQDVLIEGNESFTVALSDPTGGSQLNAIKTATVTITDDEPTGFTATSLIGLDTANNANNLVKFSSTTPDTITGTTPVTGLGTGETLIGIDYRPATGALYGVTKTTAGAGRVYVINPTTGAAALSAQLTAAAGDDLPFTTLNGANFGIDFNPTVDRLRIVSDAGQNLRVNVDTGSATTDTDLNPAGNMLSGAAYLNSLQGATGTALFGIDVANDRLVLQNPPNDGTLAVVSTGLGIGDITGVSGFDIVSTRDAAGNVTNTGYAALTVGGVTSLYTIDLITGLASSFGPINAGATPLAGLTSPASLNAAGAVSATAFTIDSTNQLYRFDTATPNNLIAIAPVSGLVVGGGGGESIIGFDFRPANGLLYAVTKDGSNAGRLYTIDTASGAATFLFSLAINLFDTTDGNPPYNALNGTSFGVDFNPFADRLRIVSDAGQSLRVDVSTGLVFTDGALTGAAAGATGAAYTNSFAGAASTMLYDIDPASDALYIQNPPNNGTLTKVGTGLNIGDVVAVGGFDIRANGEAFATMTVGGVESLYSIDLISGQATLVGNVGAGATPTLGLALAPAGTFQFTTSKYTVAENGGFVTVTIDRIGGANGPATVVLTTSDGTAVNGSDFTQVSQVVNFANGETVKTVQIPITNDGTVEKVETFFATLSDPSSGAVVNNAKTATISIADNDTNLYAIDGANNLLTFVSSAPGTLVGPAKPVTGLGAGETLIGIDFRPATGLLYGLTKNAANEGNLYVIDPGSGMAYFSAKLAANPADDSPGNPAYTTLSGTSFGLDFNPTADRLRVVSSTGQNLRINVDTGLVITDLDLNPAGSAINGAAYSFNFAFTGVTTLYGIDTATDTLVIQDTPNSGTLTTPLPLNIGDVTGVGGFDIVSTLSGDATLTQFAYATLTVGGATGLYAIDLTTGQATSLGAVGAGTTPLLGLAAPTGTPAATAYTVGANNTLVRFNTATPGAIVGTPISGITAGETIVGFDFRPSNGLLYALTKDAANGAHLYTIATNNAAATLLGDLSGTVLSGTSFDVDFNPVADLLRVISDSGQNLRIDVGSLAVTTDAPLNGPATGATGAAYLSNVGGVGATTLYEIDPATDALYSLATPNNGTLTLQGPLGVDATAVSGFDIHSNGDAFATLTVNGVAGLYSISLTTGAATFIGAVGSGAANTGFAIAHSGTIQFAAATTTIAEDGGSAVLTINRIGGSTGTSTVFVNTATGTAGTGDFTPVSRVITFGPGDTTAKTVSIPITNDALFEGNESFTATLSDPAGGAGLNTASMTAITITDNETMPTISIGDVTTTEGTGGTKAFVFNVTLSGAVQADVTVDFLTIDGTAKVSDGDYVARPTTTLTIPGGQTSGQISVTVNADAKFEGTENFTVQLSNASANATLLDAIGVGTIQNDDANSISAKMVTYTDVDGDLVTVKTTVGILSASNFTFVPAGKGLQLQTIDLSSPSFLNTTLGINAKRTAAGGDGFVNVGYIDAHGNTLGNVSVNGDLGQIDANAARVLGVLSLGKLGLSTQGANGSLVSTFVFNLPTLIVKTDIVDATIIAQNFTTITVFGNVVGGAGDHSGSIEATGRIGTLSIRGTLHGGSDAESGSVIAKTIGALRVREIDGGRIFIAGNTVGATATTANLRAALAVGSLGVTGNVHHANILIGYDRTGAPVNADVQTGAIVVTGDWVASNLAVGVKADSNGVFGSDSGAVIGGGGAVLARIASITVRGQAYGTIANTIDRFGFVAEQIGAFTIGTTRLPLSALATAPKDNLSIGFTDDVLVREY